MAKPSAAALQKFIAAVGAHEPDLLKTIEDYTDNLVLRGVETDADLQKEGETVAKIKAYAEQHRNVPWTLTLPSYAGDCKALGACLCILPGAICLECPLVTDVRDYAFVRCDSLTAVRMTSVQTVGHLAFNQCTALTAVDMPVVDSIGRYDFSWCPSLTTVDMPGVKTVQALSLIHI